MKIINAMILCLYFWLIEERIDIAEALKVTIAFKRYINCKNRSSKITVNGTSYQGYGKELNIAEINTLSGKTKQTLIPQIENHESYVKNYFASINDNTSIVIIQSHCKYSNSTGLKESLPSELQNQIPDTEKEFISAYYILCKGLCFRNLPVTKIFLKDWTHQESIIMSLKAWDSPTISPETKTEGRQNSIGVIVGVVVGLLAVSIVIAFLFWKRQALLQIFKRKEDQRNAEISLPNIYEGVAGDTSPAFQVPGCQIQEHTENIYASADNSNDTTGCQEHYAQVQTRLQVIENKTYSDSFSDSVDKHRITNPSPLNMDQNDDTYLQPIREGSHSKNDCQNVYQIVEQDRYSTIESEAQWEDNYTAFEPIASKPNAIADDVTYNVTDGDVLELKQQSEEVCSHTIVNEFAEDTYNTLQCQGHESGEIYHVLESEKQFEQSDNDFTIGDEENKYHVLEYDG